MNLPIDYTKASQKIRKEAREAYIEKQDGCCPHCGVSLNEAPADYIQITIIDETLFPNGFFSHPIHLHHDT